MTFDEARRVLGLPSSTIAEADVRRAFNSAVKLAHPDVGGGMGREGSNMARLVKAKDTLLAITKADAPADEREDCAKCKGTGSVRGPLFTAVCKSCRGSGKDANLSGLR